eukprot:COSAG06_NODE_50345_length_319_cov_0.918182_1_plen_49_part_10
MSNGISHFVIIAISQRARRECVGACRAFEVIRLFPNKSEPYLGERARRQ